MENSRFKFRIWDKESQKYHNGMEVFDYMRGVLSPEKYVMEQSTGLKDKNGKLIYEGDLIKEPANKYPLEIYYDKGAWLTREYRKNGNNEQLLYVLINCYGVEVIGNTHENADLLGEDR